jgi:hypothetical protein
MKKISYIDADNMFFDYCRSNNELSLDFFGHEITMYNLLVSIRTESESDYMIVLTKFLNKFGYELED